MRTHTLALCSALLLAAGPCFAQPGGPEDPPTRDAFDGPRGGEGRAPDGRRQRPDREAVLSVLRDIDPALAERAEALGEGRGLRGGRERGRPGEGRGPRGDRGGDDARGLLPRAARLAVLRERDPALYDLRVRDIRLERETEALAAEARRVRRDASVEDPEDRVEDLHEELEERVEAHFELRQEIRAAELERMQERLERLREDLDRREDDRDELVAQRVAELRGERW